MKIIAVANYKGGVGKTTTAHALGEALADLDCRVLLLDADPHASLTGILCTNSTGNGPRKSALPARRGPPRALLEQVWQPAPGLALATLSLAEIAAWSGPLSGTGRDNVFRQSLAGLESAYDVMVIDCPPITGLPMWIVLATAHAVLVPTQAQSADLLALHKFLAAVEQVKAAANPGLEMLGILITFFDKRFRHHQFVLRAMQKGGLPMLAVVVGRSVRVAEAAAHGQSIVRFDPGHPQAHAYRYLARHVQRWLSAQ